MLNALKFDAAFKTAPKKPAQEPQDGFAIVADVDAPESEERDTEPPQRFSSWNEAYTAIRNEKLLPISGGGSCAGCSRVDVLDYIPGERRIDYLKRRERKRKRNSGANA